MKFRKRNQLITLCYTSLFLVLAGFQASYAGGTQRCVRALSGWNFDWDDNVVFMPSKIYLFHKETEEEVGISTMEFAQLRGEIGKDFEWNELNLQDYELRYDDLRTGSMRDFRDQADPNQFRNDLLYALENLSSKKWQGPSWEAFVHSLSKQKTSRHVSIITSRGHHPRSIYSGLKLLKDRGYIKFLPPLKNIIPVTHFVPGGRGVPISEIKVQHMIYIIDAMGAAHPPNPKVRVLNQEGTDYAALHLWGFSDDDRGYVDVALEGLGEQVKRGRWPDIKITVFYMHPDGEHEAWVIKPDGTSRPMLDEEQHEYADVEEALVKNFMNR